MYRWRVEGVEHIPKKGGAILAANHASYLDPPLLGAAAPRPVHFMAKKELFGLPILKTILPAINAYPVARGKPDRAAIRAAYEILSQGGLFALFPEGTRSRTGELLPAKRGAALIALRAGAPVIPVGIVGADRIMPPGSRLPRFPRLTVRFGRPLDLEPAREMPDKEAVNWMSDQIMDAIDKLRR